MIKLTIGKDIKGKTHYYLVGLEAYDAFDQVITEILKLGSSLVDQLDAFYYRMALFELAKKRFKVFYQEDIGTYAISVSDTENDDWLRKVLESVVKSFNA